MSVKSKNNILKRIFYWIFLLSFIWVLFYISWFWSVLIFIWYIIAYWFFAYIFYRIWKEIRKKVFLTPLKFCEYFLYKVSTWLFLSIVIVWWLVYYKNEISPTPMPTHYLSNWDKTVIFQWMSHIWSEQFYKNVQTNLWEKKQDWYVYYYEWVRPWSQENMDNFDDAIWIQFDENLYKNFSKLYWVIHQDNSIYLNLVNNKDYNIDLSIDEIMEYYSELNKKTGNISETNDLSKNQETIDINATIIETLTSLNDKELSILRYINKGILNFIIWSESTQNLVMDNFANKQLFSIILDKRNEVLSSEIINSDDKKIFITYGLLHFNWVFDILKESDENWEIIRTDNSYPIQ